MYPLGGIEPVDYLAVGHVCLDVDVGRAQVGGAAAYSALTAAVLGKRVGLVTSIGQDMPRDAFEGLAMVAVPSVDSTVIANEKDSHVIRSQLQSRAENLEFFHIPALWTKAAIVHLAPIAREIPISMARLFEGCFVGITPKGWMRDWDTAGGIRRDPWPEADYTLRFADAVVMRREDIGDDGDGVAEMAAASKVLVLLEDHEGATLYMMGEEHFIQAPEATKVDATGADDIFAAAFFCSLHATGDAVGAARFAIRIASRSLTRYGLESVPTKDEIYDLLQEVR